jgi:hypothetical protein
LNHPVFLGEIKDVGAPMTTTGSSISSNSSKENPGKFVTYSKHGFNEARKLSFTAGGENFTNSNIAILTPVKVIEIINKGEKFLCKKRIALGCKLFR